LVNSDGFRYELNTYNSFNRDHPLATCVSTLLVIYLIIFIFNFVCCDGLTETDISFYLGNTFFSVFAIVLTFKIYEKNTIVLNMWYKINKDKSLNTGEDIESNRINNLN
jgi:uncharacterized membrane protein